MYSQTDIDEAVAAGALSAGSADALRRFVDQSRAAPIVDDEQFRLITGFNDIFVSIAAAILLFAVGWIGQSIGDALHLGMPEGPSPLAPAAVAATAWGLAIFFTGRRRMALPSILLLLAFVGGVIATTGLVGAILFDTNRLDGRAGTIIGGTLVMAAAAAGAAGAYAHWRQFKVPITIAAGAASAAGLVAGLVLMIIGDGPFTGTIMLALTLLMGVGVFLFAMRWDSSDPQRLTRRSDVAFWLHLLAAPMIVHPVFALLGLNNGTSGPLGGVIVIALYLALAVTALAIDRRALLVSALAYVLFALNRLFETAGAVKLNVALTALVIGSALLLLSAFWHQARAAIVRRLPGGVRSHLPVLGEPVLSPRPA